MGHWAVYILQCGDGTLYTGATSDLDRRLATHRRGKGAAYTRARLPLALVFQEPCEDRGAALRREAAIKRLSRSQKLALARGARATASSRSPPATRAPGPGRPRGGGRRP